VELQKRLFAEAVIFFSKTRTFAPAIANTFLTLKLIFMKNLFLLTAAATMIFTLNFCKNNPLPEGQTMVTDKTPTGPQQSETFQLPKGKTDSIAGFKGCERAQWSPLTVNSDEFIYQHYIVKITRNPDKPGEQITVKRDSGRADFVIPMPENGYFQGVCRNKLFADAGTGTDGRQLYIFDVDKMVQFFDTPYCGDPQIVESDRLYFLLPVEENEVTKMPDCPEKEEWTKNGLSVGYGQRSIFNFVKRSLTKKSEWACVAKQ
jgi:hypothetical protein